jgi:hypothetical protein
MTLDQPYFLIDPLWYDYDDELNIYILTDEAPQEAIDSYNEFYDLLNSSYQTTVGQDT